MKPLNYHPEAVNFKNFFRKLVLISVPEDRVPILALAGEHFPEAVVGLERYLKDAGCYTGENPLPDFCVVLEKHAAVLGGAEIMHLIELQKTLPDEGIDRVIAMINNHDVHQDVKDNIDEAEDDIVLAQRKDTVQKKHDAMLLAVKNMYILWQNHPEARPRILFRMTTCEGCIKGIAKDFCEGKTLLPDGELDQFRMLVRSYRLEAQAQEKQSV